MDNIRTVGYLAVTVLLAVVAFITVPSVTEPEVYNDAGEEFFPEFQDPTAAVALEVVEIDAETAELHPFRVEFSEGRWSIPSHHGYPADAEDHMAESAGVLIGLTKEGVVSDNPEDHAQYQVLDPDDPKAAIEGRGKRVVFYDSSKNALAELIIGKEVASQTEYRYVRPPESNRTYTAKLPHELSTKFEDWIETDLLLVDGWDVEGVVFDNYSIDEVSRVRQPGERIEAVKKDSNWTVVGLAENEEVETQSFSTLTSELDNLKIVGVRTKPAGMSQQLAMEGSFDLTMPAVMSLQSRGFFVTNDGTVYANEGDLIARTKKGVEYTLRFGEVMYGTGDAVTAGSDDSAPTDSAEAEADKEQLAANRYLMITVGLNESVLEKPEGLLLDKELLDKRKEALEEINKIKAAVEEYKVAHEGLLPAALSELTQGDSPVLTELKKDPWDNPYLLVPPAADEGFAIVSMGPGGQGGGQGAEQDISSQEEARETAFQETARKTEERTKTLEEGREEVAKLQMRFAPWYYVINDESFQKLHLSRDQLVKVKPVVEEGAGESGEQSGE